MPCNKPTIELEQLQAGLLRYRELTLLGESPDPLEVPLTLVQELLGELIQRRSAEDRASRKDREQVDDVTRQRLRRRHLKRWAR